MKLLLHAKQIMRILRRRHSLHAYLIICLVIIFYLVYSQERIFQVEQDAIDTEGGRYFPDSRAIVVSKKIDWHDYVQQGKESMRIGKGEQGLPATLTEGTEAHKEEIWTLNGFNGLLSDQIPLDRSLKDIRHEKCKDLRYNSLLPSVSIVIPFFEEHLTALQRTIVSVVNRSPPKLLKEIVLVDDGSSLRGNLGKDLENWTKQYSSLINIVRLKERVGLIAARMAGIRKAIADVIVVLDSHCEVMVGWLPPLLEPIVEDPHTVVCPLIDIINADTFAYYPQDNGGRGGFDWLFYYKRLPLRKTDIEKLPSPFENPVMNGGLFAIARKFFWELGGYDEGIKIWGGEQYNLSFKIWMCGGRLLDSPCSRVGHIFRKGYTKRPAAKNAGDFINVNYKRLAVAWMDEYAEAIYKRKKKLRTVDAGDVSNELEVRKKLKCKSFKWFLENVAPDMIEVYPPFEPPDYSNGTIKSLLDSRYCVDTGGKQTGSLILYDCHGLSTQFFSLNYKKTIIVENQQFCWESNNKMQSPELKHCPRSPPMSFQWKYDIRKKHITNKETGACVEAVPSKRELTMSPCDVFNIAQKWEFQFLNENISS